MTALKRTSMFTSILISSVLMASPLALAGQNGDKSKNGENSEHHGKRHHAGLCERLKDDKQDDQHTNYGQKWLEHHEKVAERLRLTEEQRKTWDEIHEERREKFQQRMEKLRERCEKESGQ